MLNGVLNLGDERLQRFNVWRELAADDVALVLQLRLVTQFRV